MAHDTAIPDLDKKGLRKFGLTTGAIVAVLFGVFFPWLFERPSPLWPWVICAVLAAWALVAPKTLNYVYRPWMRLGLLLSKITTPIVLGIVFYLVVTPMGLLRRLFGRDSMARTIDKQSATYRKTSSAMSSNLENPY